MQSGSATTGEPADAVGSANTPQQVIQWLTGHAAADLSLDSNSTTSATTLLTDAQQNRSLLLATVRPPIPVAGATPPTPHSVAVLGYDPTHNQVTVFDLSRNGVKGATGITTLSLDQFLSDYQSLTVETSQPVTAVTARPAPT
jgi:hypothetical protein